MPWCYALSAYRLYSKKSEIFGSPSRTNFQPLGDHVTPVETAWTQRGSQSMRLRQEQQHLGI